MKYYRRTVKIGLILFATAMLAQSIDAQRPGRPRPPVARWVYLGEANVDGASDRDTIRVGRQDGRFSEVQIRVERAPITFQRVIVNFGNGQKEELEFRDRIRAGGTTRAIDLKGRERIIESVDFWYQRANYRAGKPKVRLFAR
jgi:hypothetical protein